MKSVLTIIDMQDYFLQRGLRRSDTPKALQAEWDAIVKVIRKLISQAKRKKMPIVVLEYDNSGPTIEKILKGLYKDDDLGRYQKFSINCANRVKHLMKDARSIAALDGAQDYLDGKIDRKELDRLRRDAYDAADFGDSSSSYAADAAASDAARAAAYAARAAARAAAYDARAAAYAAAHAAAHAAARDSAKKEMLAELMDMLDGK